MFASATNSPLFHQQNQNYQYQELYEQPSHNIFSPDRCRQDQYSYHQRQEFSSFIPFQTVLSPLAQPLAPRSPNKPSTRSHWQQHQQGNHFQKQSNSSLCSSSMQDQNVSPESASTPNPFATRRITASNMPPTPPDTPTPPLNLSFNSTLSNIFRQSLGSTSPLQMGEEQRRQQQHQTLDEEDQKPQTWHQTQRERRKVNSTNPLLSFSRRLNTETRRQAKREEFLDAVRKRSDDKIFNERGDRIQQLDHNTGLKNWRLERENDASASSSLFGIDDVDALVSDADAGFNIIEADKQTAEPTAINSFSSNTSLRNTKSKEELRQLDDILDMETRELELLVAAHEESQFSNAVPSPLNLDGSNDQPVGHFNVDMNFNGNIASQMDTVMHEERQPQTQFQLQTQTRAPAENEDEDFDTDARDFEGALWSLDLGRFGSERAGGVTDTITDKTDGLRDVSVPAHVHAQVGVQEKARDEDMEMSL